MRILRCNNCFVKLFIAETDEYDKCPVCRNTYFNIYKNNSVKDINIEKENNKELRKVKGGMKKMIKNKIKGGIRTMVEKKKEPVVSTKPGKFSDDIKNKVYEYAKQGMTATEISTKFNGHPNFNAVRRWCRKRNIPIKK